MSNAARLGVFGLMALAIALSRLIEVEVRPQPLSLQTQGAPAAPPTPATAAPAAAQAEPAAPTQPAAPLASEPKTYVVQPGDILGKISKKAYGTTRHWRKILDANRDVIPDESRLRPGLVLRLPEIPKDE